MDNQKVWRDVNMLINALDNNAPVLDDSGWSYMSYQLTGIIPLNVPRNAYHLKTELEIIFNRINNSIKELFGKEVVYQLMIFKDDSPNQYQLYWEVPGRPVNKLGEEVRQSFNISRKTLEFFFYYTVGADIYPEAPGGGWDWDELE